MTEPAQSADLVAMRETAERLRKAWYQVRDAERAAYSDYHEALTEWLDAYEAAGRPELIDGGGADD